MRNLRNNIAKLVIAITPLVQACTNNTQKQGYDTLTETENISASIDSTKDTRIDINNKENSDTIHREKIQNQEIPSTLEKININELENIVRGKLQDINTERYVKMVNVILNNEEPKNAFAKSLQKVPLTMDEVRLAKLYIIATAMKNIQVHNLNFEILNMHHLYTTLFETYK